MDALAGRDRLQAAPQMLTAPGERRIVGDREVEAHHPEQGVQEPFGLAQREMVEESQGQGGLDGEIRVPPLPTPPAAPAGRPGSDRVRGQPHRHIAAANEGLVVGRPVRNAVLRLIRGMDLRLHPYSVAPAEGHEKCAPPQGLHATTPCFPLTAEDFARVNPNTGTAPIFRTRRDAALTTAIYNRLPVLVDRSSGEEVKAWPVKYATMFHMTNDSGLFRTREELEEREGAWPVGGNRFGSPSGNWVPLYEGKMVQAFDHRAANIVVNLENQHRPAQPVPATPEQHQDPNWLPDPQFWVSVSECGWTAGVEWVLGFKEITAPTNVRTLITALFPTIGFGNKVPILKPETTDRSEWLLAANLNATILDFVTRQKVQGQTLNLFIVEQLPVVPMARYNSVRFGPKTAGEILREVVLELTYTAHDMAPFARDMGYLDEAGGV